MKDNPNDLLEAVLLDEPAHAASLRIVRGAARRRRWSRYARNSAGIALVLLVGVLWLQPWRGVKNPSPSRSAREAVYVILSQPLPEGFVVRTQPQSVAIVTTMRTGVEFFSTVKVSSPQRIDDDALLQLAPGAVLVRHQTGEAQLVLPSHGVVGMKSRAGQE